MSGIFRALEISSSVFCIFHMPADRPEKHRKPRAQTLPYKKPERRCKPHQKDTPKTTAKLVQTRKENLTLYDWMTVFAEHPGITQTAVVKHFRTRAEGILVFDQATLSRKLKNRTELEARVDTNPNALSSKWPRIVTRPDVERALFLWHKHMEEKGEIVNGPMFVAKREWFEMLFDVPENERLIGSGWVPSFCKAYKIKERRRHGEAGSVDLDAVEVERTRVQGLLLQYAPKDRFNFDETSLFAL